MKRNPVKGGLLRKILRGGVLLSVCGLGLVMLIGLMGKTAEESAQPVAQGWGSEAAVAFVEGATRLSPIALANACGLGASSCFKCHNGTRAAAANMDQKKAPWHAQHSKVNNSCVGCHKGNSRIMKEEMAHAKMIAKPRDNSTNSCSSCHSADLAKVQGAYNATAGAK
jgi:nitrate/TMAO reductase-like tetraheme cytochrome c subunit